jgi:beta-glucosidase
MRQLMKWRAFENSAFVNTDLQESTPREVKITTVLDGIRSAVAPETRVLFARGCDSLGNDEAGFDEAIRVAEQADAVVLVLGDRSGLTLDCTTGETRDSADLRLPGVQENLAWAGRTPYPHWWGVRMPS